MFKIKKCNVPRSHDAEARARGTGSASGSSGGDGKPTRIRNVLNENQLHTLRACYAVNPRPDATMKEQLEKLTSLSPRVIRVWFQNKRCKDKKKTLQMKLQIQQKMLSYDPRNMYRPPPPSHQPTLQDTAAYPESADRYDTCIESDDSMPISP